MSVIYTSLVERSLDLAAGTRVNRQAYEEWGLNLAKLQSLGRCYREGWLHNVLTRITPITHTNFDDYYMMADLFITEAAQARELLTALSRGLSAFATAAAVVPAGKVVPLPVGNHLKLYQGLAGRLEQRFGITAPAPFASTTISGEFQARIPFIRQFLAGHFQARSA